MIIGQFDERGRPFIEGRLLIPRLGLAGRVNFLVDTGASGMLLHPRDASDMDLPFGKLVNPVQRVGIGGAHTYYTESASILFLDSNEWRRFDVDLNIAPPNPDADRLPSLMGREVLNQMRMDYDFPARRLEFTVSV